MITPDARLLSGCGIANLPAEQAELLLQRIYDDLELRIGSRLMVSMSRSLLLEFDLLTQTIDGPAGRVEPPLREEFVRTWLEHFATGYLADPGFIRLAELSGLSDERDRPSLLAEYAATKWLGVHRPDYCETVAVVVDELRDEIRAGTYAGLKLEAPEVRP